MQGGSTSAFDAADDDGDGVLLAVDLGLKGGLAWFDRQGRLVRYRSCTWPDRARYKRAVHRLVVEGPSPLVAVVVEGDSGLARAWEREAEHHAARFERVGAEVWRRDLLLPRERRDGASAKEAADVLAREVIRWSDARRPTSLTHDVAEAILIGFWAVWRMGWLASGEVCLRDFLMRSEPG